MTDRVRAPSAGLSPTAKRLLSAAEKIVRERGIRDATLMAIGVEAGEQPSLIHYYFGSKDGLLKALIDQLVIDSSLIPRDRIWAIRPGWSRARSFFDAQFALANRKPYFKSFFQLMPHILNNRRLRTELLTRYQNVMSQDAAMLVSATTIGEEESELLATLSLALLDGLGLQVLMGHENERLRAAHGLWCEMVKTYGESRSHSEARGGDC